MHSDGCQRCMVNELTMILVSIPNCLCFDIDKQASHVYATAGMVPYGRRSSEPSSAKSGIHMYPGISFW